jgi:hypothetical protein
MRAAYTAQGVTGYYTEHAASYRNPHFARLCAALGAALDAEVGGREADLLLAAAPAGVGSPGGAASRQADGGGGEAADGSDGSEAAAGVGLGSSCDGGVHGRSGEEQGPGPEDGPGSSGKDDGGGRGGGGGGPRRCRCGADAAWCNALRLNGGGGGGGGSDSSEFGGNSGGGSGVLRVLDLACGSGEASLAVHAWLTRAPGPPPFGELHVRGTGSGRGCSEEGQGGHLSAGCCGLWSSRPHPPTPTPVPYLCPPHTPPPRPARRQLTAADPFTADAYRARTGLPRVAAWSFEDVQEGALEGSSYDVVVISFALHLLDPSRLYATLHALARAAKWLLLLSPIKRPRVPPASGWDLRREVVVERVHARLYASCLHE